MDVLIAKVATSTGIVKKKQIKYNFATHNEMSEYLQIATILNEFLIS